MVFNTLEFGRVARSARGDLSQDDITARGGPPRQRQAPIERGDRVELSDTVLAQLDMGYAWAPDTARALLVPPPRPEGFSEQFSALSANALGLDQDGEDVTLPDLLITRCARDLLPIITRWPGPVLIGIGHDGTARRDPDSLAALIENWDVWTDDALDYRRHAHYLRAGLHSPAAASAIALDPIVAVHSFRQVVDLFLSLAKVQTPVGHETRATLERQAFTLLFVASEARRRGLGAGLNALDDLVGFLRQEPSHGLDQLMGNGGWDVQSDWEAFRSQAGLSSRFEKPDAGLVAVFDGLNAIRDFHVDATLVDPWPEGLVNFDDDHDPDRAVRPAGQPAIRDITELDGAILFYNASLCPELPVIVDWAYRGLPHPPLVISDFHDTTSGLSSSKFIMVDNSAELDTEIAKAPRCSRLVQTDSFGRAIFVPARSASGPSQSARHVWLARNGRITSNRHDGAFRLTSAVAANQVVDFYRAHKASLGPVLSARHNRFASNGPLLTLVDSTGHQMRLWGPPDFTERGQEPGLAPVVTPMRMAMVSILEDAGFGSVEELLDETHAADRRIFRSNPDLVLPFGVDRSGAERQLVIVNASQFTLGLCLSDDEGARELVVAAILGLCNERPTHEVRVLTLIGENLSTDSPWTSVTRQPHLLAHFSPAKPADLDTVLEKFDATLQQEIDAREAVPRQPGISGMPARRQPLPHLLVAIDGFADVERLLRSPAFCYAVQHGKTLGIHLVLCGPGQALDSYNHLDCYHVASAGPIVIDPEGKYHPGIPMPKGVNSLPGSPQPAANPFLR